VLDGSAVFPNFRGIQALLTIDSFFGVTDQIYEFRKGFISCRDATRTRNVFTVGMPVYELYLHSAMPFFVLPFSLSIAAKASNKRGFLSQWLAAIPTQAVIGWSCPTSP
jgi:hypothetical protein